MARLRRRPKAAGVDTHVRLGALELPNPIVAASGTFGHGDEVARQCDPSRLGAVTTKSLAPYEWPGNPAPRLHMTTAGMLNAVGLQGPGVEHWVEHDLPGAARSRRARHRLRVGPVHRGVRPSGEAPHAGATRSCSR